MQVIMGGAGHQVKYHSKNPIKGTKGRGVVNGNNTMEMISTVTVFIVL